MKMKLLVAVLGLAILGGASAIVSSDDNPHGQLSWECADCHSTESWSSLAEEMKFSHKETGFRLDGAHQTASCLSCHGELKFSHVGTSCADCHSDHHLAQLGNDCQNCHITRDWQPRTDLLLEHSERGFPLTGVHAVADCESCHRMGDRQEFVGTATDCQSCHKSDLARAIDPNHDAVAFSSDCRLCHHSAFGSWERTTFEHPGSFILTGAHLTINCSDCHSQTFAGTPTDCYSCHLTDFQSAIDPNHSQAGFSTDCIKCHSTIAWAPATFDHALTNFPLEGLHIGVNCISCHQTTFIGTPTNCFACHAGNYNATTNPNHLASLFSTTCETCHTASGWVPASWDHDGQYFPIFSGVHNGKWNDCTECHIVPSNFTTFDCTVCHMKTQMDDNHSSVQNYQYLSSACYSCHPSGKR